MDTSLGKEQAALQLSAEFEYPDQLTKLKHLKESYERNKTAVETQLRTVVQAQLEAARQGLELVNESYEVMGTVAKNFTHIDVLCKESKELIPHYSLIHELNIVRHNLHATLSDLVYVSKLKDEVEEAAACLEDSSKLMAAHSRIKVLERIAAKLRSQDLGSLFYKDFSNFFASVSKLIEDLEFKLWGDEESVLGKLIELSTAQPALIVSAGRIIEERGKWDVAFERLKEFLEDRLDDKLGDAKEIDNNLPGFLSAAGFVVDDLTLCLDEIVPRWPPNCFIFDFCVHLYHSTIEEHIQHVIRVSQLSMQDMLLVVKWAREYESSVACLGVTFVVINKMDHFEKDKEKEKDRGEKEKEKTTAHHNIKLSSLCEQVSVLKDSYLLKSEETLRNWINNLLESDRSTRPYMKKGLLMTNLPVDLFKMCNSNMEIAKEIDHGIFYTSMYNQGLQTLIKVANSISALLEQHSTVLTLEYCISACNNAWLCMDYCELYAQAFSTSVAQQSLAEVPPLDVVTAVDAFRHLGRAAAAEIACLVSNDLKVGYNKSLSHKSSDTSAAMDSSSSKKNPTGLLTHTLTDYLQALAASTSEYFFRKVTADIMFRIVEDYIAALFSYLHSSKWHPDLAPSMYADARSLENALKTQGNVSPTLAKKYFGILTKTADLLSYSLGTLALPFEALIEASPDCCLQVLDEIIKARGVDEDGEKWSKADVASVVSSVEESIWHSRWQGGEKNATALKQLYVGGQGGNVIPMPFGKLWPQALQSEEDRLRKRFGVARKPAAAAGGNRNRGGEGGDSSHDSSDGAQTQKKRRNPVRAIEELMREAKARSEVNKAAKKQREEELREQKAQVRAEKEERKRLEKSGKMNGNTSRQSSKEVPAIIHANPALRGNSNSNSTGANKQLSTREKRNLEASKNKMAAQKDVNDVPTLDASEFF